MLCVTLVRGRFRDRHIRPDGDDETEQWDWSVYAWRLQVWRHLCISGLGSPMLSTISMSFDPEGQCLQIKQRICREAMLQWDFHIWLWLSHSHSTCNRRHGGGRKYTAGWTMLQIRGHILSARFEMENHKKKYRGNKKKQYFRSLVDRGPPQRRKTKKTKRNKNNISEVLWIRAIPKESWNIVFFCCFVFWFSRGFFWLSPRGPPQRVPKYCFFFCFFLFSRDFSKYCFFSWGIFWFSPKGPPRRIFKYFFCFFVS